MILNISKIIGFIFTSIVGVLLHFIYDLTNKSIVFAPFSAVNESIWEHMKLLFFPLFILALIEYSITGQNTPNFWCNKTIAIISGLILIPTVYYLYTGALGVNADWFNIIIFFLAIAFSFFIENLLNKNDFNLCNSPMFSFVILCIIALLFLIFTFVQPKIPLFLDTTTKKYGM